jgi:hypothetical protein
MNGRTSGFRGGDEGREVDMGGEIGAARFGQGIGRPAVADGLQGVVVAARPGAIVESDRGAGVGGKAGAELGGEGVGGLADFNDIRLSHHGRRVWRADRALFEPPRFADVALGPTVATADELADGQGVKKFVGHKQ